MSRFTHLDKAIIECLNRDSRTSSAQIARELGTPERTVRYRIQRLIAQDVIRPTTIVNPTAFGYNLAVDIFCELTVEHRSQAIAAILGLPEVTYVAISTGEEDISLQAIFKDTTEMQDFITHKLHHIQGIRRTRTVLVPRVLKDTYQWLPPQEAYEIKDGNQA